VKRGVLAAGGLPIDFPTTSLGEVFLNPTSMMFRNLMSIDVEEMVRAQPMDSVVLIGGCDKTIPAQLMGAASAGRARGAACRRPDDADFVSRRAPRRMHRLPPFLGAASRGQGGRAGDRGGRRKSCDYRGHLRSDGHGIDDGVDRGSARHGLARQRGDSRGAFGSIARR
jgi:hypothetical protein